MIEKSKFASEIPVDISSLSSGMYYMRLLDKTGAEKASAPFIKQE